MENIIANLKLFIATSSTSEVATVGRKGLAENL
jgi:hypothetical protein